MTAIANTVNLFRPGKVKASVVQCLAFACLLWLPFPLTAHETPIALFEIREIQPNSFLTQWTYSSSVNKLPPSAILPAHCNHQPPRLDCGEQGLNGRLSFERLGASYSAVVVRITHLDLPTQSFTLTGAEPVITLTPDGKLPLSQVAASFIPLGFEHILMGVDHLLFILGLMMLVKGLYALIKTITAFTIAHSLTLAAATLGWVGVPETPVNAAIALSIVIVAVEVINERRGIPSWSGRFAWSVAFGFGLLHGFGFSSALTDIGLPPENIPAALLFFNIGVEIGQISFVLLALTLLASHRRLRAEPPRWLETVGIYSMGGIASFWFISRFVNMILLKVII